LPAVALEIREDAIAPFGAQARQGVGEGLLVPRKRPTFLIGHHPIIREP
jgi:hypothetical protein